MDKTHSILQLLRMAAMALALYACSCPSLAAGGTPRDNTIDVAARTLAGMEGGDPRISKTKAWQSHAAAMADEWSRYEASTLVPMEKWSRHEVTPHTATGGVVRYLFSGPDILHALRMFPDAQTYILGGLEPVGAIPDMQRLRGRSTATTLGEIRKSLEEIIHFSFFRTKDMKVDLAATATLPGTLPILCLFLVRSDQPVRSVEFLHLTTDGGLQSLGQASAGADAVKIIAGNDPQHLKTIYYFQSNVADGYFEKSGFMRFLQSQPRGAAYLKAASYLLHNAYFSNAREHLLEFSDVLVEDDSGIPLRHFDRKRWDMTAYGNYSRPIDLFKDHYQPDLHRAYQEKGVKPIDFGSGYRWRKNDSNLLRAVHHRGDRTPAEVAATETTETAPAAPTGLRVAPEPKPAPAPLTDTVATLAHGTTAGGSIELNLRLLQKSALESPAQTPGGKALGVFEYEVIDVQRGNYSHPKIRVAHGIVWDGRFTSMAQRDTGWLTSLDLVPIDRYPSLKSVPIKNDLPPDNDTPLYVPKLD